MATRLTDKYLQGFVGAHEFEGVANEVKAAHKALHEGTGLGNDFIGWLNLPTDYDKEEFARIKAAAEKSGITPEMSYSEICDAMKAAMVEITIPGLTGGDEGLK